ncbi:MAG: sugar ABC transporter ATP-binding protein [Bacteroidetes bacterium]|nr:MAG: sugar ABC transporter ATP-binding protein [Bacteroidota bacterium]
MLEAKHITKRFDGVIALSDVNLQLHPGKVNAIIGENGAGKSTLMKIFSGVHTQYEGEIVLNGDVVRFANTKEAEVAGIAIIHQELNLVPYLSVTENIFLGRELVNSFGVLDKKKMQQETAVLLKRLNLNVSPSTKIVTLKVGQQQLVEIAKALYTNATIIIMDEPTSAISDKEVENLFGIIAQLKKEGKTIVYISHKLKELFTIADNYIILRDGQTVDAGEMRSVTQDELIQKMTGRKLGFEKSGKTISDAPVLLTVKNLSLRHPVLRFTDVLSDISFDLHKGEILGVYGLMGAGRTELMESIFGLHPRNASGEINIKDQPIKIKSPADAIAAGIALVPEDRKLHGLVLNQTIKSNISITVLKQLENWGLILNGKKENQLSKNYINQLGIKTNSDTAAAKSLSGGNQQKIVLAKWLATNPQVLLLDEPTRGIDINAKAEIYKLMKSLAATGMGIVMVSSELPEILAVSDRVLVLCEGELTASIPIEEATEAGILKYALHKNTTAA